MNNIVLNNKEHENRGDETNASFDREILRRIIKESWRGNLGEVDKSNGQTLALLDDHATRMEKILQTLDYEVLCMPNVISNSRRMTRRELNAYLACLEALAIGYKYRFDNDFVNIFLAGLVLKAKDLGGVRKCISLFIKELETRAEYYKARSERHGKGAELLTSQINKRRSSLLRFFKRGEILVLNRRLTRRNMLIKKFSGKADKYAGIVVKVKGVANLK